MEETSAYSWYVKVSVLYNWPTSGKQLPAFPTGGRAGIRTRTSGVGGEYVATQANRDPASCQMVRGEGILGAQYLRRGAAPKILLLSGVIEKD